MVHTITWEHKVGNAMAMADTWASYGAALDQEPETSQ